MRLWLSLALTLIGSSARASYRVYELNVRHLDARGKVRQVERVLSTLDASQYGTYHRTNPQLVEVKSTWFCPGNTSRKAYCSRPKR